MKRLVCVLLAAVIAVFCLGCGSIPGQNEPIPEAKNDTPAETPAPAPETDEPEDLQTEEPALQEWVGETGGTNMEKTLRLLIGDSEVSVEWQDNESVEALKELVKDEPLTVKMSMYGGFEQVGSLGTSLPRNDVRTVTEAGDIVLYSGNQIVVFYGSNSWSYTRLGRITDKSPSELSELLGNGDAAITLSWE